MFHCIKLIFFRKKTIISDGNEEELQQKNHPNHFFIVGESVEANNVLSIDMKGNPLKLFESIFN